MRRKGIIKFPLQLRDGEEARSMEELREYFDLEKIIGYFQDGRLVKWLDCYLYADEADEVRKLSGEEPDLGKRLCDILGAKYTEIGDTETIIWRKERLDRLKQFTADTKILNRVDMVAFDQDDLEDIIREEDTDIIYLCQNKFTFPSGILRKKNVRYVGIGKNVEVEIQSREPVDFESLGIKFDNVKWKEIGKLSSSDLLAQENTNLGHSIDAPMPGKIKKIIVNEGQSVKAGETLLILEAMKMESEIASDIDGIVKIINVTIGQHVTINESLLLLEKENIPIMNLSTIREVHSSNNTTSSQMFENQRRELLGHCIVSGIGVGKIHVMEDVKSYLESYRPSNTETEKRKFQDALSEVINFFEMHKEIFEVKGMSEAAGVFDAHRLMCSDPMFIDEAMKQIEQSCNAPQAAILVTEKMAHEFEQMDDEYFDARAIDLRCLGIRLAKHLLWIKEPKLDDNIILYGQDINYLEFLNIPLELISGIVQGSTCQTTYLVEIAQSKSIPMMVGIGLDIKNHPLVEGSPAILMDRNLIVHPSSKDYMALSHRQITEGGPSLW